MIPRRWNLLLLLVLIPIAFIAACSNGAHEDSAPQPGNIRFVVTAPPPTMLTGATGVSNSITTESNDQGGDVLSRLTHVNVTFSALMARNLDGMLVNLVIDLPATVDLISVMQGREVTLPTGTLPAGMYDQIVVVIRSVEFVLDDGTSKLLTPPGGGWTRIIDVQTFEVIDGQTITLELRFNPLHAFTEQKGEFEFSPDFDCHRRD